jgi:hypothetical protein
LRGDQICEQLAMMLVLLLVAALVLPGGPLAQNSETERYVSPWETPWTYEGPTVGVNWIRTTPLATSARNSLRSTFLMRREHAPRRPFRQ